MTAEAGPLLRAVMEPIAEQIGLDDWLASLLHYTEGSPLSGGAEDAFRRAACGADLLLAYRFPEYFPAYGGRARRRGAKWVTKAFGGRQTAVRPTIFLAHALGLLKVKSTLNDSAAEQVTEALRELQAYVPVADEEARLLEACCREYAVLDSQKVDARDARTGYHMALLDPDFGDPNDPELIEAQRTYASRYLRLAAGLNAIAMAIGPERLAKIEDDLMRPDGLDSAVLTHDVGDLSWWADVGEKW